MTPSGPSLSTASATRPAISSSPSAATRASWASIVWPPTGPLCRFSASSASRVSPSKPRRTEGGSIPAATRRSPAFAKAPASSAVVVEPSPTASRVFLTQALSSSVPRVAKRSSSSRSLIAVKPSRVSSGKSSARSSKTRPPRGPRVRPASRAVRPKPTISASRAAAPVLMRLGRSSVIRRYPSRASGGPGRRGRACLVSAAPRRVERPRIRPR